MIKLVDIKQKDQNTIKMSEMKPYDIGEITSDMYAGEIVMRTASASKVEVFSLSRPRKDGCWTGPDLALRVRLFPKGTKIELVVE
jgi:hypothetical protein